MNPDSPIENELTQLGQRLGGDGSLPEKVMEQIHREGISSKGRRAWRLRWPVSLGSALAASLLIVLFFRLGNEKSAGGGSLYAQAVDAIQSARTLHAVMFEDGDLMPQFELYYERGVGTRQEVHSRMREGDQVTTTIDDTQHEWQLTTGSPIVHRRKSPDPAAVRKLIDQSKILKFLEDAKRDPSGDKVANGESLQLYVHERKDSTATYRELVWLDASKRVKQVEEMTIFQDGKVTNRMKGEVTYDMPVDRKLFTPNLPAQATIVDSDEIREKDFSLEKALYKQEVLGMIFAVHRVERLDNGRLAIVSSIRPTDETRRLVGPVEEPGSYNFAQYQLKESESESKTYRYHGYELGMAYDDGMQIRWTLFSHYGWWPDEMRSQFIPSFSITAEGPWAAHLTKAGQKTWENAAPKAAIPATESQRTIADFAGDVYEKVSVFQSSVSWGTLITQPGWPMSDQEMAPLWEKGAVPRNERLSRSQIASPHSMTLEAFQKAVASRER